MSMLSTCVSFFNRFFWKSFSAAASLRARWKVAILAEGTHSMYLVYAVIFT